MPELEDINADRRLVQRALAGRRSAYEELVYRWSSQVLAVCYARVGCHHVAEDLAQETMIRGLRALGSLKEPEKLGAWLRGIAVRVCFDWLKSRQNTQVTFSKLGRGEPTDELLPAAGSPAPDAELDRDEQRDAVMQAVESLPEDQREVIMLYYFRDVTYRDLAEMLDVSQATINARLSKARATLRRRLTRSEARS